MYEIKRPEIVLLQKNANGQMEEYKRFANENELVDFLARFHKPILSWYGNPIHGQFQNNYMDFQCLYRFYLDVPGHPLYDVRNLEPEVRKTYYEKQKQKPKYKTRWQMLEECKEWHKTKQGRKSHTCYNAEHHSYISGVAQEIGLMYDDDEYRQLVKPKMLQHKYYWSDDFYTRRSSGWKDNSGNRYRKQWERDAVRKFKKEVKEMRSK